MELRQYFQVFRKWWWLIVLGTGLAAGVSYGVSSFLPPTYQASTSLLIKSQGGGDDYGTVIVNQYLASTYSELLTKQPIVQTAGQELGLSPATLNELVSNVTVWVIPNTSVIRLTVESSDPSLAAAFANEVIAVFVKTQRENSRNIEIVEPALPPTNPVAPRRLLNTLIAGAGGFALAAAFVLAFGYLDDTLSTEADIKQMLALPTLAAIPASNHPHQHITPAEAYRTVYARLQFANGHGAPQTLLITSPHPSQISTTVALNLATAIANAGRKVLLVEANLRQPILHHVFGLPNELGLTTLLAGSGQSQACLLDTGLANLRLLPSGPPQVEGWAWLDADRLPDLLETLKMQADVILFNAPPVLTATETMVLASQVAGTILVIESHGTRQGAAKQAEERLRSVQAKILGVILSQPQPKRHSLSESSLKWWRK